MVKRSPKWTVSDIPDQSGRTVVITGANSGLGLHSAHALASKGARVLLACRSPERAREAMARVAANARVEPEVVRLDLADLSSVHAAAEQVRERTGDALDLLMNNAGVMASPQRATTDGFELQIGTNHLGHAALTWLLMPALRARPGSRVVTLSSLAHRNGIIDADDLNFTHRRYRPGNAYSQAKLANLVFALELDRRLRRDRAGVLSVAAHPGLSGTELAVNSSRLRSLPDVVHRGVDRVVKLVAQSAARGALPQLYAATAEDVRGGEYFGPDRIGELSGHPHRAKAAPQARSTETARRLWRVTAELTGVPPDPE